MKKIIKLIGLFVLIGFSFFYTDKILEVIRQEDKIMIKINEIKDNYEISPVEAKIIDNKIIPGINGQKVNINKSYNKMQINGIFNEKLLVFDEITPNVSITNNKDKFIISGNSKKNMVSIIFILNNNLYFDMLNDIFKTKESTPNYFVDYTYLINNSIKIKETNTGEFYSYGNNGNYSPDNLLFSNNLLTRIKGKEAKYCLSINMDNNTMNLCNSNNLYTISPNIIGNNNLYNNIKNNLTSGSIILMNMNGNMVSNISTIIDYIKGKGYKIVGLSTLLSEEFS